MLPFQPLVSSRVGLVRLALSFKQCQQFIYVGPRENQFVVAIDTGWLPVIVFFNPLTNEIGAVSENSLTIDLLSSAKAHFNLLMREERPFGPPATAVAAPLAKCSMNNCCLSSTSSSASPAEGLTSNEQTHRRVLFWLCLAQTGLPPSRRRAETMNENSAMMRVRLNVQVMAPMTAQLTAGLSQCERSCQRKWGTQRANCRCDCYRPDTLGGWDWPASFGRYGNPKAWSNLVFSLFFSLHFLCSSLASCCARTLSSTITRYFSRKESSSSSADSASGADRSKLLRAFCNGLWTQCHLRHVPMPLLTPA